MAKADMYLRLESKKSGAVKGESNVIGHVEEIELNDWSWAMTGSGGLSAGGRGRRTALGEIRFSKGPDRATTGLMSMMDTNDEVKTAVVTVRKAGANPPVDYLVVTVSKGRITSYSIGNRAPGDPELVETFSIAFEKIQIEYAPQGKTGGKQAQNIFEAQVQQD
jgi:type VI secretion system secreted protein Hcp